MLFEPGQEMMIPENLEYVVERVALESELVKGAWPSFGTHMREHQKLIDFVPVLHL